MVDAENKSLQIMKKHAVKACLLLRTPIFLDEDLKEVFKPLLHMSV